MAAADLDIANPEIIPDRLHVLILISDAEKHRIGEADSNGSGAGIRGNHRGHGAGRAGIQNGQQRFSMRRKFSCSLSTSGKAGHPEVLYGVADPAPVTVVEMTETIAQFREELPIICRRSPIYG